MAVGTPVSLDTTWIMKSLSKAVSQRQSVADAFDRAASAFGANDVAPKETVIG